ncbi:MAG: RNA-binding protein [Rhodobacteraceae bacterium]|nr:RNA-binding protein [Paracoccaceae bacterium]
MTGSDASLGHTTPGRTGAKLRAGAHAGDRRCIVTGEILPRARLIRFVVSSEGVVVPDIPEKLPGRGMWVSADRGVLEKATRKNPFLGAAQVRVALPDGFIELVETRLAHRVISLISLARRSGDAICGYEKTKVALNNRSAALLAQASDGSSGQKRKLRPPGDKNTCIFCLTAAELGLAFGRQHVIHAALMSGGLTETIRRDAKRLAGVRKIQTNRITPG